MRLHAYPVLGDRPIGSIRSGAMQSFISAAAYVPAPSTLRMAHTVVVAVFAAAVRDRKIPTSPCQGVRLPEARRRKVQPHDLPDLAALNALTAALPERFRAVVPLVAGSGLRPGEVLGLEVRHLPPIFEAGPKIRRLPALGGHVQVDQQLVSPNAGPGGTSGHRRRGSQSGRSRWRRSLWTSWPPISPRGRRPRSRSRTAPTRGRPTAARPGCCSPSTTAGRSHATSGPPSGCQPRALPGCRPPTGLHVVRHWYASALIRHGASVKAVQAGWGTRRPK